MIVGSQICPGPWGRNFVDSVIAIISMNIKQIIAYRFVGIKIRGQGLPMKATYTAPPTNNNESTVPLVLVIEKMS